MNYSDWRDEIFGQPEGSDPVWLELSEELEALSPEENLAFIVTAMADPQVHERYTQAQIGIGLQLIFSNSCSDLVFGFLKAGSESDRVAGMRALSGLYANYFARYCGEPVVTIGDACGDGVGYMCYMFWDIFVVCPGNSSAGVIQAALGVMREALRGRNEQCQVSALHGLGHWVAYLPEARKIIEQFIAAQPADANPMIMAYAEQATTGCVE